jgi:hypothetical protein
MVGLLGHCSPQKQLLGALHTVREPLSGFKMHANRRNDPLSDGDKIEGWCSTLPREPRGWWLVRSGLDPGAYHLIAAPTEDLSASATFNVLLPFLV